MRTSSPARIDRARALACVPEKNPLVKESKHGGLPRITYPQPTGRLVKRLMAAFGRAPETVFSRTLELDEMGAVVWRLIDGKRPVSAIVRAFADRHGLQQSEAEASVTAFLRELGRRGIILIRDAAAGPRKNHR